ncbi:MAG: hypothetical protein HYU63_00005, partial [Armatimonadetes bacterium]|nr:hypothetical protein [Armatimonadota bacterium]
MNWNKNKEIILTILIAIITILSWLSFYDYKNKNFKIKLGLDLRSGSHLTLRLKPVIDPSTKKLREINYQVVKQTIEILERRINPHGTMELIMQPEGLDRIIIEIPEMTNLKEVEDLISQTAHLEFKEQFYNPATKQLDYRTVLDGTALSSADVGFDSANNPVVSFTLNKEGAKEFAKITERNVGKPLAIFFDEKLID